MKNIVKIESASHQIRWSSPLAIHLVMEGKHVGIVAIDSDDLKLKFMHLADEKDLRYEDFSPRSGILIYPELQPERELNIAAYCRRVWVKNNGEIPYSFSYPNEALDKTTGKFLVSDSKLGLTCASLFSRYFTLVEFPWPR